jgi:hypothetical protein
MVVPFGLPEPLLVLLDDDSFLPQDFRDLGHRHVSSHEADGAFEEGEAGAAEIFGCGGFGESFDFSRFPVSHVYTLCVVECAGSSSFEAEPLTGVRECKGP